MSICMGASSNNGEVGVMRVLGLGLIANCFVAVSFWLGHAETPAYDTVTALDTP